MDAVILSRIQFAFTAGFHFLFPPLTIGLAWFIFWILTKYKKTGDSFWKNLGLFWVKLFSISFVIGVATGLTLEFQFGTNWSEYSRFVGDIFGAPLAAEGIFAFFLESCFLGVLVLGWRKFSPKILWISSLMVAIGSTLSAFWIIAANSWQQTPAGFHILNGRAELTNFWAAVFNPSTIPRYVHTIDACLITGAFFMMGISAWYLLKGRHLKFAQESLKMALAVAFISSILIVFTGHFHAVQVAHTQPEKLAAIEGLFETQSNAPALLFGIPDRAGEKVHFDLKLPGFLSLMAFGKFSAVVKGLKAFPKEEWPPLALTFYPFHLMVALGTYFVALSAFGIYLLRKKKLFGTNHLLEKKIFLKLAFWSIPLPFIVNQFGWISAEVGRQPWIVYHLLKTKDAISITVPAWQILFSLIMFIIIYAFLFGVWLFLIKREVLKGFLEDDKVELAMEQKVAA